MSTDKHDIVRKVEQAIKADPVLTAQFDWLLKVWNTEDDRTFESFDPTRPYGAEYDPQDDPDCCEDCGMPHDECECDAQDD